MWNVPSRFADQRLSCVSLKIVQSRLIARKDETLSHACERTRLSQLKTLCCFCAKCPAQHFVKCTYWPSRLTGLDKEISRFAHPRKIHPRMTFSKPTTCYFTFLLFLSRTFCVCLKVFLKKKGAPMSNCTYFRSLAKHTAMHLEKTSICDVLFWKALFFPLVAIFRCSLPPPPSFLVIVHLPIFFFVCPLGVAASVCSFPHTLPPHLPPLLS